MQAVPSAADSMYHTTARASSRVRHPVVLTGGGVVKSSLGSSLVVLLELLALSFERLLVLTVLLLVIFSLGFAIAMFGSVKTTAPFAGTWFVPIMVEPTGAGEYIILPCGNDAYWYERPGGPCGVFICGTGTYTCVARGCAEAAGTPYAAKLVGEVARFIGATFFIGLCCGTCCTCCRL